MLKGAHREHKTVMEVAKYYTDAFFDDCRKLNIKRPDTVQPATGLIDDYIKIITKLLDTGYAYLAGGNVYFDTSKLKRYYVFNDHNEEDLAVGVREGVEEDTNKKNKNDFVLWFTKSKFEDQALKWDSPLLREESKHQSLKASTICPLVMRVYRPPVYLEPSAESSIASLAKESSVASPAFHSARISSALVRAAAFNSSCSAS